MSQGWKEDSMLIKASQHVPIYLQPFPSNSTRSCHFSIFFAHFGFPVRPWDNRGKCYMDRKRIQCLSNASQHVYPSIFNHFWDIAVYRWRVTDFQQYTREQMSVFNHILLSPRYASGTIVVNVTWIERECNACQTPRMQHVPIYIQPFPSNSSREFKSSPF